MNPTLFCYILLLVSVITDTARNIYNNHFGKHLLSTTHDALLFNVVSGLGAAQFVILLRPNIRVSRYSMILALIFAAITAAAQYFSLESLATGPMSYSVLFSYLGMIIPTAYGMIAARTVPTVLQCVGLALMIVTFFLCSDLKKDASISPKWIVFAVCNFLGWGLVGVCQIVQQSSDYADELRGFLFWSFIFTAVLFTVLYFVVPRKKGETTKYKLISTATPFVFISGLILGAVNLINLYIAGRLPSVIVFPILNGGVILLAIPAAFIFYKERVDRKKLIGLAAGLLSVILLSF